MVLLKVLSWILRRRAGFLLLGLMAISAQLMGQSLVGTGSQPFAVAVNPATNKIYVVNRQGTVTIIDGATNTAETERVGGIPVAIAVNPVTNKAYVAGSDGTVTVIDEGQFITKTIRVDLNPQAIVVNPLTNKIYVAAANGSIFSEFNPNGNVSVIDGTDDTVKTTFPVGKNPFAIALNPVTNRIYVANEANGSNATVNVIDGSIDLPVGSPVRLGSTPSALAVNPVTNKIYVTNGSNLSVISGVSNTVVTTTPLPSNNLTAIAVNPVTNFIYITIQSIGIVMAVNGATDTLALSGIALIGGSPSALAVNSLTNLIYVTDNATTGHVVVIDGSSNNRVDSFLTGNSPGAVAANPVTNRVYVANFRDNNVAVVDGATKTTSTIIAGSNPNAVAVNQVTNKVYVPNFGDNTVTVIDAANGSTTSTVIAGTGPTAVAVNPATNKIYVPNSRSGDVTVIDGLNGNATTQVSAGLGPFAVAVNTVTNKAYVTNSNSNNVTVIDGITNETSNLSVGTTPRGLVVDEVTDTIVVANQGSNDITAFDGKAKTLDTVQVGNSPVAVGVNTAENNFYVVNQGSDDITVIDGDTLRSIDRIRVGTSPGAVVVNPLTNKIYVANQGSNSVSVIDGGRGNVIATVGTGSLPYALDLNLLTNKIYVTNQNGNTVTVIDGTGDTFSATVPTGTAPSGVTVNPVTNKVYVSNLGSANVTEITVGAQQPVPLNIALTPVVSDKDSFTSGGIFSTFNETPSFNVTVTSAYSSSPPYASIVTTTNPPPTQVYFSVDGVTPWSLANPTSASGANPASFAITLSPLDSGLHTLYVFATYGNAGGHNSSNNGTGNSPEISNLQRLPLLVLPTATTTALVSDFPNGAQENTRITFTATVTANSSPVTAGMVQFKADGKTQGDPIPVNSNGVATDTNNTLTSGSHIIEAVYLGTDQFLENSASLTQIIYGIPTSITVSSGTPQTAAVNTSYASPLVAIVKDAAGDPVPNVPVRWDTDGTLITPNGSLSALSSTTDANGLASVNVTANNKTGSFHVTGSAVGTPARFTLTNTAGAPTAITIHAGSSPQTTVINTQFTQPLSVNVADANGNPVQGVTVTYVATGTTANATLSAPSAVTDSDGLASVIATANGTAGSYTVTATAGSVGSVNFTLRNNAAGTSTSLLPPAQTVIYGNAITLTAAVNQTSATGTVNFFLGTELLGSATLNGIGSANLTLNQLPGTGQYLPVGTYSNITATYTGDNNFGGSTSGPVQVTVTKKTGSGGGPALTVVADSVTRPFGQPNPAFSYTTLGTIVPGDSLSNAVTGTAVYTTSAVPGSLVGTYPLSVSGLVSANYEIAFQDGTVTVTQGNSTTTIATASTNIMYGDQEVLTAAVTQGATGTVSFYEGSTLLGTASLDSATQAELPFDNLPVGIHTITATFNGGPNLLPSTSSPATVTVTQTTGNGGTAALTIVVRNATRPATGEFAVFTYYVTGQLFNNDTYETAITGTPSLASPAGSDPGTYPITISGLTSNNYTLTSVPGTLIVTDDAIGKPSTTTLTVNPSSGQYGDPITLTATVSPTVASGRVTFYDVLPSGGTVFLGDATLSGGTATFIASTLNAGTHSVEAAYSGDGIYSTSLSLPSAVTVAKKQGPGGGAALTITVQNASRQFGTANPYFALIVTGTLLPGDSFESAVTGAAVYATTDTPSSPVGTTYPITVSGPVSQNYEIATVPGTLSIVAASSTTTLASASVGTTGFTAAQYGDTVTLTATIAPTTATGTVVFQEGQNILGTAQVGSGTGIATLALTTLQAGRHTITETYLGDNNLGTSTSTPVTIVVSPKTGPSGEPYLLVTADDTSRIYGQANPAFTYTVSGTLLNGDTPATAVKGVPIYSTPASLGSPAGTYPVSIVGGLSSLNYLTEFQAGTFTVTPTSLTVSLASSANPVAYGSAVLFTATLPIDATGTVIFYDGPTILGTGSISGGVATQLTSSLTAGTHSITAQYGGDVNYGSAVSTPVSQVVSLATPTVTLASSLNPSTFGASVTFTATLPTDATGSVTFLDGATTLGPGTISSGVATLTTGSLAAGTHSITAQYGGDSNYSAAVSTPVSQVVNKASSTVALASSPNPSTFGTSVTLTATVPSGAIGTVTFDDGTTSLGTGTISGGVATLATSSLTAGTHSITAQYGGDTNYIGAVSTAVSQVVNKATPAVTLASSLNPSTFGTSVTLTATVPSGATGTVTFDDGATSVGTGTISGGGATLTISSLAAGTHSITAQYGGDTNYTTAASTAVSQIVNKATPTVTLASSLNPSTFGVSVTLTATVPSEATGIVTFDDGATSLGTGTISSGVASLTTSSLAAGTHSITAQYGGDTNYNGAVSTAVSQVVNKVSSTVALATSLNPSTFGASVTLTATVTSGATGTVTFEDGTTSLGTGTINSGVATLATSSLPVGTHSITAQYGGNSNYNAAVSTALSQVVNLATPTVALTSSLNPSTFGASVTVTATVTSGATGTATFEDNGTAISGAVPISGTTAAFATSTLVAGSHAITAVYSGDSNYNGANSLVLTQTVNMATTGPSTTLSVSPTTVMYGDPAVLTAVVGPPSGATGTVSFHEGATLLGTSSLDGSTTAVFSVSTLNVGTHTITATYNGDVNFPASTSNTVTLAVTQRTGPGGGVALTVTVNDATRTTTEANPPFSHTVAGELVNGDTYATAVTGTPTYATAAGTTAGTFEITVSGLTSQNYVLAFVPGTLTVVPSASTTTLAASPNSSQYGDPVTLTATVTSGATGAVSFYDSSVFLGEGTVTGGVATLITTTLNAATHTITATYNGDATYASSASGPVTVTVAKKTAAGGGPALTVTVENASREYGTANPEFAYIVSGTLVNGDTYETAVTGVPVYTSTDTPASPVGSTFPINVSGLVSQNYTLTTVPGTLTIVTAPTTTVLTTNVTSTQYGDPGTLTATVAPSSATGTVVFSHGSTVLGTAPVSGGTATLSTSALSVGTYTITASYEGDGNFAESTSSAVTVTVAKRTGPGGVAALTVTVTDASRQYGQGNPAFSYTVSGTLVNGDTYATAVTGVPVYSTPATVTSPVGTYPISITGGLNSANYSLSFVNGTLTVSKGTPTVTVVSSLNPSIYGTSVTLTATVPAGATGTVTFEDNGVAISGAVPISGTTATLTTSTLAVGTHSITAVYSGDTNYNGATSAVLTQVVNHATLIVTANSASRPYGTANPAFTSTITGFVNGDTQASVVTGAPSLTTTATAASPVGTYSITAAVGTLAATNYTFTFVNGTLTVDKATPGSGGVTAVTVSSSLNPSTYGASVTFTAAVPAGATGTVTFEDNGTAISGAVPISGTTAAFATSTLLAGTHAITTVYSGDSNYNGANSLVLTQTVNMATTGPSTTLSVSPTTVMYGDPAVLTAVVGPPSGATGTVSFHEGATLLGTSSLDGSTTAVFSVSTLNVGTHPITATYNGDVNFPASTSNPVALAVTQRTGAGGGAALTVTVNDATRTTTEANPPFSHTVAGDLVNGDTYATAVTGTPTYSTTAGTTAGTFAITVTGLSSANYTLAFVPGTLTVVPSSSTTTLAASPNSSLYGDPVTLTATVTSGATGTASFYDGSVYLGQEAVTGGVATLITTTLNVGTHTITATYNGDATYASSMSEPATVTVAKNTAPGSSLTVTVLDESREYGTANPEFAYIVSGTLVNGDTYATAVTGVPVYSSTDTPTSPVGSTFPINVSGLVSQNYTLTTVPGTLTIVTAPTTTSLTTSATSTQYGDPVTLTATVAPSSATGTVVFSKGFTVLGTATVSGGTATFSTSALSAGTNTITASYEGDGNFAESTSSAVTVTVAKRTGPGGVAALTVTVTDASRQYGQGNPAFSYTVSGTLVNGDTYATAVTGVPVYSTPATVTSPVGTYPISITGGLNSANYSLSFVNGTLTVSKGTSSVTLASSQNPSTPAVSVTFTATLSAGATGTVTFDDGATSIGTGTISSGVATLTTNSLAVGTHSITAQYGGDSNFNTAVSTAVSQVVNKASSTVTLASSLNPSTFGASVTFTATLPAGAAGTVTFDDGATSIGTGTINSGIATLANSSLAVGTHAITAVYSGDTNYTAAVSTPVSQVVNKATPTVTLASSLNPSTYGTSVTFTAAVPAGATGTVTFEDNGAAISGAVPISGTTAAFAISTLLAGSHAITAVYSGDSNYNGANSLLLTQTVNMATTGPSTTLSVSPTMVMYGDPAVLTAVVGPPSGATGTVSFHEGATLLGTSSLDGSTTAVFSVSTLNLGTHTITATYNGDVNFPASTSNPVALTVTQRTGAGGGAALTVTVNDATRTTTETNPPFSHTVAGELVNGDTYATAVTGTPTYSTTAGTTAGTFEITVSGLTSQNYVLAFVPGTLTVVPSSSTTTLATAPSSPQYGDPVTLTATVTSGATGTASFYDSSVFLGEGTVTGGVATLITTTLNAGTHTITAIYNGDATYASSTSGPATVTVAKKTAAGGGPALTVTVENESREYGTANPEFAYIVSGALVNGDTYATAVTGVPVYSVADSPSSPVGSTFPINVSGLVSENYTLTTVPGTLTIVTAPTTTALTTSVTSTQYGDPVTLAATVAPSSATGTVVFSQGSMVLGSGTVSGGTATLSTPALSVGTYTITASYEGDGNYAESTSSPVTVTVAKRTGPDGGAALTVTVTDASRQYGQGNPAFSYTVTGTLVNGDTYATAVTGVPVYSTPATVTSPVGTYPISITGGLSSANYSLAFVNGTLTVSKGTPTVTVASSQNSSIYGTSVTLTAAVPAGASGTVTFEDNGTEIGTAMPISGTTVALTTSTLAEGTHPIIAVYSGDTNYNGAASSVLMQVVNKATLTVTANDTSRPYGVPNPAFTSTITGFVNGDTQGSVTTGAPSLTTSATAASPAGTYSIIAAQGTLAANNNYGFAFVDGTLTVTPSAGETTTLSVNPATVMYGEPAVLTAVVGPTAGATGTVSFHEGATLLGTSSLDGNATAVLPVSILNAGTHSITATYNGDVNFPASTSNPVTLTVTQRTGTGPGGASLTVTINDATRTTTEANPPFSHTVAGELVSGDTYATAVTGTPTYSTTAGTTAGTFAITVTGLSSANYVLAFVPGTLTVVPSSTTTTLATSPNSSQYGDPVTLTATVTPGATGTASFYDSSVYLGQGAVTGGVATLVTTTLNVGTHTITATYNGDATYASSMSGPATVTVIKNAAPGSSLTVTVENASREYGTANPEFSYIVSGTLVNGDTYATAVTGVPVYSVADSPNSPVGSTFPINVSGLVSQNYTLTTVPGTLTIVTAATTTALTIATTTTAQTTSVTLQYGDPVTLTATVAPTSVTGTVVFSNGSMVVGTATVSGGTATLTTSSQSTGTKTITTSYQGDANHAASTSSPVTAIVTPRTGPGGAAALTVTVTNASRQYGQGNPAFSYTVTGTLVNGDTYATAVTGVPVYSTTATVTSPVGTYPVSVTGGLSSANYSLAFVNGSLTVSKGTPSVTVASSQNPSTPAASVTFTATLSAGASGTVTFMDGTTVMGIGTVSSGTANFSTTALSVGTHSITAAYSGDGNYNGVTSPALAQVVNKTATTVTVASSRNPVPSGSSVTFTATVPAGVTGTVQFLDGMTVLGAGTVSGGTASFSTTTLSVGTHSITAVYSGDATYNGATSSAVSQVVQTVGGTQPTFTVASTTGPQLIPPGASASYSITVTPVNGAFNNVVTLTATNLPPGSSYTFAPPTLTPGSAAATSTFTVNVPKQSAALRRISKTPFALAVLLLPLAFLRRTRARPPRLLLWLLLGLTSSGAISGCGSGGYFNQPQQTYTITITAASGNLSNSSTVTLTVQ